MTAVAELPGGYEQAQGDRFEVTGYGIDDVTFGFDMTGSRSLTRLNEAPG